MTLDFQYIAKEEGMWPLVFYSSSLNTVISCIFKNGSSALETWTKQISDFEIISYQDKSKIFDTKICPNFITVLRDPVERAISAIHMLQLQQRRFGLHVTYENYTNIQVAYEPHIMPQSCFIPTLANSDEEKYDFSRLWDILWTNKYKNWTDALSEYDVLGRLTDQNIFFYAYEGQDIIYPLTEYLNLPYIQSFLGQNSSERYGKSKPKVSDKYRDYLKEVYAYDYKLIDSVKFVNK